MNSEEASKYGEIQDANRRLKRKMASTKGAMTTALKRLRLQETVRSLAEEDRDDARVYFMGEIKGLEGELDTARDERDAAFDGRDAALKDERDQLARRNEVQAALDQATEELASAVDERDEARILAAERKTQIVLNQDNTRLARAEIKGMERAIQAAVPR